MTVWIGQTRWWIAGALVALCVSAGATAARAADALVFAAASLTGALGETIELFERRTSLQVDVSFAASSALARQIDNGAPADLYLSANAAWMDYLEARGDIAPETRRVLLGNRLVLIAPGDSTLEAELTADLDLAALLGDGRLVLGDPDHVPAGIYARQALEALGLWSSVEDRTARQVDVRAALAVVERGEAPLGVVYATDAAAFPAVHVVGMFPAESHEPIVYPVALVAGRESPVAHRLLTFLSEPEAMAIFARHGFTAP